MKIFLNGLLASSKPCSFAPENKLLGMEVTIFFKKQSPFKNTWTRLNNVTEVDNLYKSAVGERIAFESDIHQTGITHDVNDIEEVRIVQEAEVSDKF